MSAFVTCTILLITGLSAAWAHPYLYNPYYRYFRYNTPYYNSYGINYANTIQNYSPLVPTYADIAQDPIVSSYLSAPEILPTLNILAEMPYSVTNKFTVVPMLVMAQDNMNLIANGDIMSVSKKKPMMTVKTEENSIVQCTPAVRINLEHPIIVYSLKTSVLFPTEIDVEHQGVRIPIRVGAVIAPVDRNAYVSLDSPVTVNVVYAVPTRPITFDYVAHDGVTDRPDSEAVVVESEPLEPLQPINVTIIDFPEKEAEPSLQVDESDEELVNRNPPILLAPAGIVQSTQPLTHVEPFSNSKESPILIALREEAKKRI